MSRPVVLGNGSLTVGLNEKGLVHDFYYPYVGLENLTTARSLHHKLGISVNGTFSWLDSDDWTTSIDFQTDALISEVEFSNEKLQAQVICSDFVDWEFNAFCRQITLVNTADSTADIKLFCHQVFQLSQMGRGDTALYVPEENYILDYKGRCSLLISGQDNQGTSFDQFAVGNYGIEGKEGTFRDAEDGELSGSAVEHGGVDSVIRFSSQVDKIGHATLQYWIVAADSQYAAEKIHNKLKSDGLEARKQKTIEAWQNWMSPAKDILAKIEPAYQTAVKKSLLVIKAHTDRRGGIIASTDSSIYNYGRDYYSYVWPRDGAFAIWPLIRMGFTDEPKKFFEFCRDIMAQEGYLMHKYQPDKAIGSTWHPQLHNRRKELAIQEDETAIVIYMLGEYLAHSGDEEFVQNLYHTFIQPAANFMQSFVDDQTNLPHASYDLWEQKFLTTTYTTFVVYQALVVAGDLAEQFNFPDDAHSWRATAEHILENSDIFFDQTNGYLRKGLLVQEDESLFFDNTLDTSSLYGALMFGNPSKVVGYAKDTLEAIENTLKDSSPSGGVPRYEHDDYFLSEKQYLGNPWFVTSLWLAQIYIRVKDIDNARKIVDWSLSKMLPSGILSEQINPTDSRQVGVSPLVWSHAELINTILDLEKVK